MRARLADRTGTELGRDLGVQFRLSRPDHAGDCRGQLAGLGLVADGRTLPATRDDDQARRPVLANEVDRAPIGDTPGDELTA